MDNQHRAITGYRELSAEEIAAMPMAGAYEKSFAYSVAGNAAASQAHVLNRTCIITNQPYIICCRPIDMQAVNRVTDRKSVV